MLVIGINFPVSRDYWGILFRYIFYNRSRGSFLISDVCLWSGQRPGSAAYHEKSKSHGHPGARQHYNQYFIASFHHIFILTPYLNELKPALLPQKLDKLGFTEHIDSTT